MIHEQFGTVWLSLRPTRSFEAIRNGVSLAAQALSRCQALERQYHLWVAENALLGAKCLKAGAIKQMGVHQCFLFTGFGGFKCSDLPQISKMKH